MLDTDTCIYARKSIPGFQPRLPLYDCGISVVVLGELEWGVQRSQRIEQNSTELRNFLATVRVASLDAEVARRYGQLRADLAGIGRLIGPNDLWVAAHALALDLPLVTHNLAEFERVPGLDTETWMTGAA